jgi:hypothetical protein
MTTDITTIERPAHEVLTFRTPIPNILEGRGCISQIGPNPDDSSDSITIEQALEAYADARRSRKYAEEYERCFKLLQCFYNEALPESVATTAHWIPGDGAKAAKHSRG